jgi:hypothetical protein
MKSCCRRQENEENRGQRREDTHGWVGGPNLSGEECVKLLWFLENRGKSSSLCLVRK